ncbi:MAG: SUMF1/EgtB/PvdO family nonheme iron enzyme, partial [Clostridia bacterium]|nr:SUMF1/EgtB/PvdO family nonheme iron enzyme [Clostridia bacterium]
PYIIYSDGELFKGSNGNTRVPIPDGFVASGATGENDVSTGLVIYEGTEPVTDSNVATARTTRNQFVWVPVDGNAIKYQRDTTISNSFQSDYNAYSDWTDSEGQSNVLSVAKYGGFYIGRYEAGWAQKENEDTYETDKTTVSKNDTSKLPVCRKGYAGWNYITQANSKTVCENMYKNNESVKSQLIDSYAWDAAVNWFNKTETCKAYNKITNSVTYGNYSNNTSSIPANTLYAIPIYSNKLLNPISYRKSNTAVDTSYRSKSISAADLGNYTNDESSSTSFSTRLELSTGASEDYNLNNVYDMAGNFWEWTTEVGKRNSTSATATKYAVHRGCSFNNSGGSNPVVYRNGHYSASYTSLNVGFRPVLYLK